MLFLFFSHILSLETSESVTCPAYKCNNDQHYLLEDTCIYYSSNNYYIKPCEDSLKYCPIADNQNSSCVYLPESIKATAWPGESCVSNSTCTYGYCNDQNICKGLQATEECKISDECDPRFYCYKGNCRTQQDIGEQCTTDYDCVNNAMCLNQKCVGYFTKKAEDTISCNTTEYPQNWRKNWLCESGICHNEKCLGYVESDIPGAPCSSNTTCYSSYFDEDPERFKVYSDCSCGFNANATAYCDLLPGDQAYKEYLSLLHAWTAGSDIGKCNTVRRFDLDCMKAVMSEDDYYEFYYRYLNALEYPSFEGNDECVEMVYTENYEQAKEGYDDWADFLAVGTVVFNLW